MSDSARISRAPGRGPVTADEVGKENENGKFALEEAIETDVIEIFPTQELFPAEIAAATWGEIDTGLPRYEILKNSDVDHESYCEEVVDFTSKNLDTLPEMDRETWLAYQAIVAQFTAPEWSVELRRHVASCDHCDASTTRLGVRVSRTIAGIECRREYGLQNVSDLDELNDRR